MFDSGRKYEMKLVIRLTLDFRREGSGSYKSD